MKHIIHGAQFIVTQCIIRKGRMEKKMSFCYDTLIRRQPFVILTKQKFELIFLASLYACFCCSFFSTKLTIIVLHA